MVCINFILKVFSYYQEIQNMLWYIQIMVFFSSCRCLHTIKESRMCCGLCKSWYLYVYLVVVSTPSGNPEHVVVVYKHHGIYMFYLVGVYLLSGTTEHSVVHTNHGINMIYNLYFSCLHNIRKSRTYCDWYKSWY